MTVYIADDEKNICTLLKRLIDWEGLNLSLAGEANDGRTAWAEILEIKPDIVIIDIKMPEMDGLEVIQRVKAIQPEIAFVLISGHREFEYAHAAIRYGVENYLLKPINRQTLDETLRQTIGKLQKNRQQAQTITTAGQNREQLRSMLMKHLMQMPDALAHKDTAEICRFYGVDFAKGTFRIACIQPDSKVDLDARQGENLLIQIEEWFSAAFRCQCAECLSARTRYRCFFLVNCAAQSAPPDYRKLLEQAQAHFYPFCHLTIGLSAECGRFRDVETGQAERAVRQRLSLGTGRVIAYGAHHFESIRQNLRRYENDLWQILILGDRQRLRHWFESVAENQITPEADPQEYVTFFQGIMERYIQRIREKIPDDAQELELLADEAINRPHTRESLLQSVLNALLDCQKKAVDEIQKRDSTYVWRAKEYVRTHCHENITLEDISRIIFINPTYFCTLFKKEEGIHFSEYLTRYRLERAKILLSDFELSITDVARQVGYSDARHFSKIFYKAFGVKPSEYRRTL